MSLLSLLINLRQPCWIHLLIKKIKNLLNRQMLTFSLKKSHFFNYQNYTTNPFLCESRKGFHGAILKSAGGCVDLNHLSFFHILDSISVLAVNRIAHKRWRLCPTRIFIQRPLPKRMTAFLQPININDVLLFLSSKTLCCPLHFSSVNLPESSSCVLKHISPKNVLVCQSERGDEIARALERLGLVSEGQRRE